MGPFWTHIGPGADRRAYGLAHAGNDRKLQDNVGSPAASKRVDLLFLDAGLEVRRVFVDGEEVLISRSRP